MTNIVDVIREWHPVGQFVFLLGFSFLVTVILSLIVSALETFFNNTIPIIIRGWPPGYKEEDEDGKDSNN